MKGFFGHFLSILADLRGDAHLTPSIWRTTLAYDTGRRRFGGPDKGCTPYAS